MYKKRLSAYRKIGFDVITDLVDNKQNVNHIYNYNDYLEVFRQDIHESNKSIIISSPQLNEKKVLSFIDLIKDRQEKGVSVNVFTKQTDEPYTNNLIDLLYGNGVFVEVYPDLDSYFAVIDQEIVWHGGINLLGKSNIYDSLMVSAKLYSVPKKDDQIIFDLIVLYFKLFFYLFTPWHEPVNLFWMLNDINLRHYI